MLASVRFAACAGLLLGVGLLLPPSAQAQDPNAPGLNLSNPYAKPNTGSLGSSLNETVTPRNEQYDEALARMQSGDYNGAMLILNKLIAMDPIDADALTQLGYCYQKQNQPGKAMSYYKKVIGMKPQHLIANEYAGELLLDLKNLSGAEERLTVLQDACVSCDEYNQLKARIDAYKLSASQG
ncbi:tetratricopeptide repeat protein [Hypericibacter sp.]|uniref:tetratricopeptide repeat protein n=1 Tax=Hypericibacter sp. TaxID=2705401 RepID=UPI003D6C98EE